MSEQTVKQPEEKTKDRSIQSDPDSGSLALPHAEAGLKNPSATPSTDYERKINFSPREWSSAFWRKEQGKEKVILREFDLKQCITEFTELPAWVWQWSEEFRRKMHRWTAMESEFWLHALCLVSEQNKRLYRQHLIDDLSHLQLTGSLSAAQAMDLGLRFSKDTHFLDCLAHPIAMLLSLDDLLALHGLVDNADQSTAGMESPDAGSNAALMKWISSSLSNLFADYRFPRLTDAERAKLDSVLRKQMRLDLKPYQKQFIAGTASRLGLGDICQYMLDQLQKGNFSPIRTVSGSSLDTYGARLQDLIFGLNDVPLMLRVAQKWTLKLLTPDDVLQWIAYTEYSDLARVAVAICDAHKETATAQIKFLAKVDAPEAAAPMLRCFLYSEVSRDARKWLDEHPTLAFDVISDVIIDGKLENEDRERCLHYMTDLLCKIDRSSISSQREQQLRDCGVDFGESLEASAQQPPAWLESAFEAAKSTKTKKNKLPNWLDKISYAPLVIDGWRLTTEQSELVLLAMQQSATGQIHPLLSAIRQNAQSRTTDRFLWDIFERWNNEGSPPKEKWAFISMGYLASDKILMRILPMMYAWREAGLAPRAGFGLECMRASGSDFALLTIQQIADSPKLKSLRNRAIECMMNIAADKGLTKEQLEDRIVPSCGLDDRGKRVFNFGPRQFTATISPELKVVVRDDSGKSKSDLPAPNSKDDVELANSEIEEFKELKKQIKAIAKIQVNRLEQAMVTGRTWTSDEFVRFLVKHPLMCNFVRMLVWSAFDAQGKMIRTFRVTEENEFADAEDRSVDLTNCAHVAVSHPFYLADELRARWGEILSDYEIVAPFPQMARPVYLLNPEEDAANGITRFAKSIVPGVSIPGTLERLGWTRGPGAEGGWFTFHYKHFFGANLTAIAEYDGMPMGLLFQAQPQAIRKAYFVEGIVKPSPYESSPPPRPLKNVDKVVLSEVLNDLTIVSSKSKGTEN